jgi:hypothetical protein
MTLPKIYFYLPQPYLSPDIPTNPQENWSGFGIGIYAWTLQTYLHLQR